MHLAAGECALAISWGGWLLLEGTGLTRETGLCCISALRFGD